MKKMQKDLVELLRRVDGFAYVNVSSVVDDVSVPVRMHNEEEYARLKESIESEGILVPLILLKKRGEEKYYLVDGRNRLRAARELGIEDVPALIYAYGGQFAEDQGYERQMEEAKYLAMVIEQARRHLSADEIRSLIEQTSSFYDDVAKMRLSYFKNFTQKLGVPATVREEVEEVKAEGEVDDLQVETYRQEIEKKEEERRKLIQELEKYKKEVAALREKVEMLESGSDDELPDVEYFSTEVGELTEEEKERIKKEAEEKAREIYLAKLKDYEEAIKQLKDDLSKKDREIRMLNEKIRFTKKTTDEVKKALGKVIGINTLVSKINVLMEEAESIADVIGKMEINNLMYSNDEWKVVLEKWKEFKSYVEFLDSQINEAVVLCNKSGGEIIRLVDNVEKNQ